MSERENFEEAASRLGFNLTIAEHETGEYHYQVTQDAWDIWQEATYAAAREQKSGKGSLPWFVSVYNSGYESGHHDTVEGGFTPIHHSDKDTYHEDQVMEILEDLNVQAYRDPAQPQGVPELKAAIDEALTKISGNDKCLWEDGYKTALYRVLHYFERSTTPPADKPEGEWVKCWYRLPTEADGYVWLYFQATGVSDLIWRWDDDIGEDGETHWTPTGLTRPQPPEQEDTP